MSVRAITGVDHGALYFFGEELHGAAFRVADDNEIRVHGVERHGGVDEGFAFFYGGVGSGHVDDVGAETFASQLEGGAGAGGIFEKEVDECAAFEEVLFFVLLAVVSDVGFGGVEDVGDVVGAEAVRVE